MRVFCCRECKGNTNLNPKPRLKRILFSNRFAKFIRRNTKQAIAGVIYSQTFKDYLLSIIEESRVSPFKEIARQYIEQEVIIETTAGQLEGVVTFVGDDYLELAESPTSTVLLPFTSINTIQNA
ncbi:DUF2642 domain-containing protein [Priestia megaterium]